MDFLVLDQFLPCIYYNPFFFQTNMDTPALVDPGIRSYLDKSLRLTKHIKEKSMVVWYNFGFFLLFLLVVGGFLISKYKGKKSRYESQLESNQSRQYILSKLQRYAAVRQRENPNTITHLPMWDKPVDM